MKRWQFTVLGIFMMLTASAFAADTWKTTVDLDGRLVHLQETNLGDFIANAMKNAASVDIAVIHASAFEDEALIKAGLVDEQAFASKLTIPASKIFIFTMKPAALKKMMERAVSKSVQKPFLQIAGMTIVYDSSKETDNRIVSITIGKKLLDFDDEKTELTVALPDVLARGASGYSVVFPRDVKASVKEVRDMTIIDAIKAECNRLKGEISTTVDGRLKDVAPKDR